MRPLSQWTRRTVGLATFAWVVAATAALALWIAHSIGNLRGAFAGSARSLGGSLTDFGVDPHAPLTDWLPLLGVYVVVVLAPAAVFVLRWRASVPATAVSRRGAE